MADRDRNEVIDLHRHVTHAYESSPYSEEHGEIDFVLEVVQEASRRAGRVPSPALQAALHEVVWRLLMEEPVIYGMPGRPDFEHLSIEQLHEWRAFLRVKERVLRDPNFYIDVWREKVIRILEGQMHHFPSFVFAESDDEEPAPYQVSIVDVCAQPTDAVERTMATMYDDDVTRAGLFDRVRQRLDDNLLRASGLTRADAQRARSVVTPSSARDMASREVAASFLAGTPFAEFFLADVPFRIPQKSRFEHMHILAGTGHGKTQTIQHLLTADIDRVIRGEASIVVIDSQGDLIRTISNLKVFADEPERLCVIDPHDIDHPVALNLFDMGMQRLERYSALDKERLRNSAKELLNFVLSSLLGSDMTSKQATLFDFTLALMLEIPGATIHTFRDLMQEGALAKYQQYVAKLDETAQDFFNREFDVKRGQFETTKKEVVRRLYGILSNATFRRMFSHEKSKLDLFSEMNSGKVILIDTAKDLLKENGTEVFGRFFIALIANAAQERATLHPSQRLPCFVYIDECHDYISSDANVTAILEQARKQNVGLILAHQYLSQISQGVLESLFSNTSIKFVGGVSDRDAHAIARELRCAPSFIQQQQTGSWAAYVKNFTPSAISLKIPFGTMEALDRMAHEERVIVQDYMRSRYAALPAPPQAIAEEPTPPAPGSEAPRQDNETPPPRLSPTPPELPTAASKEW
ncbi:MAG: type IV secretory system conjugative DNA transfer family protein [Alphaproteobacteria bacterium]